MQRYVYHGNKRLTVTGKILLQKYLNTANKNRRNQKMFLKNCLRIKQNVKLILF